MRSRRTLTLLIAVLTTLVAVIVPAAASAQAPESCTTDLSYDPSIPTFEQVTGKVLGAGGPGRTARVDSDVIWQYFDAMVVATANHPRVKLIEKPLGTTYLGRKLSYYVVGTKDNIDNLDAGRKDGPFWAGVRDGHISAEEGLTAVRSRPALAWATETPHGNEPAGAEALARVLYELAARTDCQNLERLKNIDLFMMPVRNPDGRDNNQRTSAWGFDHNRDFGTRRMKENAVFMPEMNQYPGVFFIDAHQQSSGYFFPPNEDPVHHELSNFTLDFIQNKIGPALQRKFNDQSSQYRNYYSYDLFTPEYGDTVPSFLMGAAGMTYEKGVDEVYGKQVYDHYLAIDETINVTSQSKPEILADWVGQWQEAIDQGEACRLQENKLVSPLHDTITQQPDRSTCGYFFRPDSHVGDKAKLFKELREVGVHIYRLDTPVNASGVREFGKAAGTQVLPAGTFYIPMAQSMKHWVQAVLGEEPWVPFPYFYDVAAWSYSLQRGLGGDGYLVEQMPAGVQMTEMTDVDLGGVPATQSPVYAFNTDAMAGLGLLVDLVDKGVTVYRSTEPFTSGGTQFFTGAALVDAASLPGKSIDLPALAKARQTPVKGLTGYPAEHQAVAKPKIALYAGAAVPQYPLAPGADKTTGQCVSNTSWCEAMFVLASKIGVPTSAIVPFTTAQLEAGQLVSGGYTAFVNPNGATVAAGAGATALQAFVNAGGRYVGNGNNAVTTGRNAGLTAATTTSIAGMTTGGVELDGTFDTTNPVAWGFDRGGWIYRTGSTSSSDPIFEPLTGGATAAVSYTTGGKAYGYQVGALGAGKLEGRPAVVTQTLGSGVSTFIGFNPYFRAWKEQDDRIVLNAILYPTGAELPAAPGARESETKAAALAPVASPVAKAELPAVVSRPVPKVANTDRDVRIVIRKAQLKPLKAAVKAAKLTKKLRSKVRYVKSGSRITFVVKGVRTSDEHARKAWVGRLMGELKARQVKPVIAQL